MPLTAKVAKFFYFLLIETAVKQKHDRISLGRQKPRGRREKSYFSHRPTQADTDNKLFFEWLDQRIEISVSRAQRVVKE